MTAPQYLSSLSCELRIIRAKTIELKATRHLFVRCYLSGGNNSRVGLNTREISSNSDLYWGESVSLDCSGTEDSINMIMQSNVIFELRRRQTVVLSVVGIIGGSQLLGRAELPWKSIFEAQEMAIEKWVTMVSKSGRLNKDVKPPALYIGMKVGVLFAGAADQALRRKENSRVKKWDECGCMDGRCKCVDYDMFAL